MKKFLLINKIYFYLLAFLSFSFLIFNFYKNDLFSNSEIIFLTFVLVCVIFLFNYFFIIKEKISEYPINIFFNLYLLINILFFTYNFNFIYENTYYQLFYFQTNETYIDLSTFKELYNQSIIIIFLTVIFFNFSFILTKKLFQKKIFNFFPDFQELDFLRLTFFLLLIKLLSIFIFLLFKKSVPQLINPINMLIVAISFYSLVHFEKNKFINSFIISFIFIENLVLTFGLYKNIILLIVCFIIIYNFKKKISLTIFCLILIWVFLGQTLKVDFRKHNQKEYEKEMLEVSSKEMLEVLSFEKMPILDSRPIVLRLTEPIVSLIRINDFEKVKKQEIRKDTISILAYSLIPRFIYAKKPKQNFAAWYTDYFFNVYKLNHQLRKTVTYNIFWTSDFYLNYQYYGSIILSFIFGFILSLLSKILTNIKSSNLHYLFGLSIISGFTFPDYNISLMLSPILLQIITFFILLKILILFIKK